MKRPSKLRVLYDVSFCAESDCRGMGMTGVARVIENLARQFEHSSGEVALEFVGCRGGDPRPALTSACARRYWERGWKRSGIGFSESVRSRFGLLPHFSRTLPELNFPQGASGSSMRRLARKAANALAFLDEIPDLNSKKFDLFHAPFYAPPSERFRGRPQVVTIHDLLPLDEPAQSEAHRVFEQLLFRLDHARTWCICVSEYTRDLLVSRTGFPPEQTAVVPLAAETVFRRKRDPEESKALLRRLSIEPGPYFLSVANPQPRKNLAHLVRCFQRFASQPGGEDAALILTGSRALGWGMDIVEGQRDLVPELRSRIHFVEQVDDEDLATLYSHALGFLFPSLKEGFGLPPLEAMQCGAPVVCSRTTSLPEVVGEAAFLIDPECEADLVSAMQLLAGDPAQRAERSAQSLLQAAKFSWARTASLTAELYRRAVAENQSDRPS